MNPQDMASLEEALLFVKGASDILELDEEQRVNLLCRVQQAYNLPQILLREEELYKEPDPQLIPLETILHRMGWSRSKIANNIVLAFQHLVNKGVMVFTQQGFCLTEESEIGLGKNLYDDGAVHPRFYEDQMRIIINLLKDFDPGV